MKTLIHQVRYRQVRKPFWWPGGVRYIRPSVDIDSDNNGYINNWDKNPERNKAEDLMEESTAKPITYFPGQVHPRKFAQRGQFRQPLIGDRTLVKVEPLDGSRKRVKL